MEKIDVTVSLQKKREFYQAVMQYKDKNGVKQYKWKSTGIKIIKGQKKELKKLAEEKAEQLREDFEKELNKSNCPINIQNKKKILFTDYLKEWLDSISNVKAKTTIGGYQSNVNNIICPYFEPKKIKLVELTTLDLQDFYDYQYKLGKSARTVKHYHNNIHKALEKARKTKLIISNPATDCQLQKPKQYIPQIYNANELKEFLEKIKNCDIEIPVMITSFYGLRRSEVLGLKWNRIDFNNNTITIAHVVTSTTVDQKRIIEKKDIPKNSSSYRTLPLIPIVKDFLEEIKKEQAENKKLFKGCYKNDENYVCVDMEGKLILPDILTKKFPKFLKDNNLRKIRFHDLRHSIRQFTYF